MESAHKQENVGIEDEFDSYCQYWSMKPGVICNKFTGEFKESIKMANLTQVNSAILPIIPSFSKEQEKKIWYSGFTASFYEIFYWFRKSQNTNFNKITVGTSGWRLLNNLISEIDFSETSKFTGTCQIYDSCFDLKSGVGVTLKESITIQYEPHFNIDYMLFGDRNVGKTVLVKLLHTEELYV